MSDPRVSRKRYIVVAVAGFSIFLVGAFAGWEYLAGAGMGMIWGLVAATVEL